MINCSGETVCGVEKRPKIYAKGLVGPSPSLVVCYLLGRVMLSIEVEAPTPLISTMFHTNIVLCFIGMHYYFL